MTSVTNRWWWQVVVYLAGEEVRCWQSKQRMSAVKGNSKSVSFYSGYGPLSSWIYAGVCMYVHMSTRSTFPYTALYVVVQVCWHMNLQRSNTAYVLYLYTSIFICFAWESEKIVTWIDGWVNEWKTRY